MHHVPSAAQKASTTQDLVKARYERLQRMRQEVLEMDLDEALAQLAIAHEAKSARPNRSDCHLISSSPFYQSQPVPEVPKLPPNAVGFTITTTDRQSPIQLDRCNKCIRCRFNQLHEENTHLRLVCSSQPILDDDDLRGFSYLSISGPLRLMPFEATLYKAAYLFRACPLGQDSRLDEDIRFYLDKLLIDFYGMAHRYNICLPGSFHPISLQLQCICGSDYLSCKCPMLMHTWPIPPEGSSLERFLVDLLVERRKGKLEIIIPKIISSCKTFLSDVFGNVLQEWPMSLSAKSPPSQYVESAKPHNKRTAVWKLPFDRGPKRSRQSSAPPCVYDADTGVITKGAQSEDNSKPLD